MHPSCVVWTTAPAGTLHLWSCFINLNSYVGMTKGCSLMWLSVSSWLLWSQNDFSHLHVLFFKGGGVCRGREVWCVLGTDLAPLDVWCIYFCWSLCIGWYLSTTANPNPHQRQCQHFYLGVVIREYNLFGKADVILYKTEKTQLSKLKNERGEDLRLWRRVTPEPPPGSPGGDITLHVLDRSCPQPFQFVSSSFSSWNFHSSRN